MQQGPRRVLHPQWNPPLREHRARLQLLALPGTFLWPSAFRKRAGTGNSQKTGMFLLCLSFYFGELAGCVHFLNGVLTYTFRFANPETPARMAATTAIKTHTACTWACTPRLCSAASADQAMLETDTFAARTLTSMDGQTPTWCAWRTPPTIARR